MITRQNHSRCTHLLPTILWLKVITSGSTRPPVTLVVQDPYCYGRGLELVLLGLELPFQVSQAVSVCRPSFHVFKTDDASSSFSCVLSFCVFRQELESIRAVCAYISLILQLPQEALTPLVGGVVAPRLLFDLLKITSQYMPCSALRYISDVLYVALYDETQAHVSALFQQSLSMLLANDQGLRSFLDSSVLDWAAQIFSSCPTRLGFRTFIKSFSLVCRGEKSLEEVTFRQQTAGTMQIPRMSASRQKLHTSFCSISKVLQPNECSR